MMPRLSVASAKPEAALDRGAGWQPARGRGWALAQRDSGREVGEHCREGHLNPRTQVAQARQRRARVVGRKDGADLLATHVVAQELTGAQFAAAGHLGRDPDVLREVEPGDALAEGSLGSALGAGEVVVGDPGDAELRAHRDPG